MVIAPLYRVVPEFVQSPGLVINLYSTGLLFPLATMAIVSLATTPEATGSLKLRIGEEVSGKVRTLKLPVPSPIVMRAVTPLLYHDALKISAKI